MFQCKECDCNISLTKRTVMEHSKLSLRTWFYAMYLMTSTKRALSAKGMQHQWIPSRTGLWWWSWENNCVTRTFPSKHLNRAGGKRSSFLPIFVFRPIVWVESSFQTFDYKRLAGWQSFTFALLDSALPCKHTCEVLWLLLTSHGKFFTPLWYIEYAILTICPWDLPC